MFVWLAFPLMFVLVLLDIPIAFSLAIVALIGFIFSGMSISIIPLILADGITSFVMLAIPLFIATGEIMTRGKMSGALIDASSSVVGFISGGLAHVNILVSMLFANISGSAVADAASLGSVLIPEMEKKGFPKDFSVAVTSASASIGIVIPPSVSMILYCVIADVSVARMFLSGFLPGITYGLSLMLIAYIISKKRKYSSYERFSVPNIIRKSRKAVWALIIPVVILGGILTGIFTTTEAAAIAVVFALALSIFVYKGLKFRDLPQTLLDCSLRSGAVLMVLSTSMVLSWYFTNERFPERLAEAALQFTTNKYLILLLFIVFTSICGVVLHGLSMMIMLVPIFLPLMIQVGVDPIHFGMIFIMSICVGEQTPPVASVLLTACAVARLPVADSINALKPFFLALVLNTFLVAYVPSLTLFLPNLVLGPG